MTLIFDTSILIDHLRGKQNARDILLQAQKRGDRVTASTLTKVEILAGMKTNERKQTYKLLNQVEWIEVTESLAEKAGTLASKWINSHPGIEVVDYVIAATVNELDGRLITLNQKHFPMLKIQHPYG